MSIANPLTVLRERLTAMGFDAGIEHNAVARTIRVRFIPITDGTRQAVKVAAQSSQVDGLEVATHYGVGEDPFDVALACVENGIARLPQA